MPHMLKIGTRSFLGTQLRYQMSIHGCILTHMKKLGLKYNFWGLMTSNFIQLMTCVSCQKGPNKSHVLVVLHPCPYVGYFPVFKLVITAISLSS